MPWGFENIPEMYVPKDRGSVFDAIGGAVGSVVDAAGAYARRQQEREMALKRMRREQAQFDARMGMDKERMGMEERGRAANLAMQKDQNAAQQWHWNDEQRREQEKQDAAMREKAAARAASPIAGTIEGVKDISQEPEMAGVNSLLQTGARQAAETGGQVTMPQFATRGGMPSAALQAAFARGAEPRMSTTSADQFTQDIAPDIADASGAARSRMAADKERAAWAGRATPADNLERDRRRMIMQALIEAAKAGREPDAISLAIMAGDKDLQAAYNDAKANRKAGLEGLPGKFSDPATFQMPAPTFTPPVKPPAQIMSPAPKKGPSRIINGKPHEWVNNQWVPVQ